MVIIMHFSVLRGYCKFRNSQSGVKSGTRLAGDPCAGDRPKLSVEMIVELSLFGQCYVRRVVISALNWLVSHIEIPFQVSGSGFS